MFYSDKRIPILLSIVVFIFVACDSYVTSEQESQSNSATTDHQQYISQNVLQGGGNADLNKALAGVRRATAKYQNLEKAQSDGYVQFSLHVPNMGYHYLRSDIISNDTSALDHQVDQMDPEILVYNDDASQSHQKRLVAVEYAIPKTSEHPPSGVTDFFPGLDEHAWHVHPSAHELPLSDDWTIHGECHYEGGPGVFLAEDPGGNFVLFAPPTGPFGSWSGTIAPDQCPTSLGGNPLPPLLIVHGKWWTLHAWVWYPNPEGVFNPTNPRIGATP